MAGLTMGDWRSKLIAIAQALVAFAALVGLIAMLTRHPYWLLGFTAVQGLIVVGVVLFVVVAIFAQRSLVEEDFEAGAEIFHEGDPGRDLYVIKSGSVEVLMKAPDGSQRVVKRLEPGDHFGEMALLGNVPRNATIRTVSAVVVLKMPRGSFATLYTSLPGFKDQFNEVMESRLHELDSFRRRA
jgi:hypothetical protein